MNKKRQKEKIVRMSPEEIKRAHHRGDFGKTDWKRLDAMTDKEIEEAVSNDPDAAPLVDPSFWQDAKVVMPESKMECCASPLPFNIPMARTSICL